MKFTLSILSVLLFLGCHTKKQPVLGELMETDRQFSEVAMETGFNKAFVEFAHPDAVLLRENTMPIVGKTAIAKLFEKADTTGIDFSWEPLAGNIAESGELGYTYGIYTIRTDTLTEKGTYVSIWKKDVDGTWKYILDSGNEGLGN